ncbi:MAG: type II secretion system F family protein, partial [Planctomycetota bacterium]
LRALETLQRTAGQGRLAVLLGEIRQQVAEGTALAETLAEHPEIFRPLHVAVLRAGERASFLEDALANLSEFIERQDELRSKIVGSLIYPAVLTGLGCAATLFVLIALVPQFRTVFAGMSQPLPTRILFAVSSALVNSWGMVLLGLVVTGGAAVVALRSEAGRQVWDRWRLKVPLTGAVTRTLAITRFCRVFGTMLTNGVPILQSLSISKDAAGSRLMAGAIQEAADAVRAGEPLTGPLTDSGLFPPEVLEMIAVAEESNQLDRVLVQIADTVERRTYRRLDQVVRLVEPLILVVIAAVIGFVALGLLYPIFTMSRTLQ